MVNTEIFPNLEQPITIDPYLEWKPWIVFLFPTDCIGRAETPLWTIEDFSYVHKDEDAQSLSLKIVNFQNGGQISCKVPLNESYTRASSHNETWIDCEIGQDVASDQKIFATQIMYDKDYSILGMKQTYECPFQRDYKGVQRE
jgi:hypothetical protein